jgi:predicted nucleic acid-binding protein
VAAGPREAGGVRRRALIALERGAASVRGYVLLADRGLVALSTSSAVVAQVWRGGPRQSRLARLLNSDLLHELPLGPDAARRIGVAALTTASRDVVDGHVAMLALELNAVVVTSDPADITRWGVPPARIQRC